VSGSIRSMNTAENGSAGFDDQIEKSSSNHHPLTAAIAECSNKKTPKVATKMAPPSIKRRESSSHLLNRCIESQLDLARGRTRGSGPGVKKFPHLKMIADSG
jgi:hypothetical protein